MENILLPDPQTAELGITLADMAGNMMVALLEQSQDCVKLMSSAGALGFMNRNGRCSMEIDDFCAVEGQNWWDMWPAETQPRIRRAVSDAKAGQPSRFEAFCPTAKGTPKWWDVTVSPVRDNAGQVAQIVSFSRDVTEQVKAKEALETMALEMRHRLRNAFTVSSAIATISAKDAPVHMEFARALSARLGALAKAQSRMMQSDIGAVSLAELLEDLKAPHPQLLTDCPPDIVVDEQHVRVIALALGELATNSLKYGTLGRGETVQLRARVADQRLQLVWREAGGCAHPDDAEASGGSGYPLIMRMAKISGGTFTAVWADDGLTATLDLPG